MRGKHFRADTRKIVGRITYSPEKHKQKSRKALREKLSSRPPAKPPKPQVAKSSLKFGSLNVNGLNHESQWAVGELLKQYTIDVSLFLIGVKIFSHTFTGYGSQRDFWAV